MVVYHEKNKTFVYDAYSWTGGRRKSINKFSE